ncbi:cobalamin-binding protein [Neisseria sp. Ec49-e6-T10]|uniref:cobalamin-binding protein n=1 Tax=Neisseria sp. Ec49-e6-T10 TaxID=3140744 RepID=UPI003EBA4839
MMKSYLVIRPTQDMLYTAKRSMSCFSKNIIACLLFGIFVIFSNLVYATPISIKDSEGTIVRLAKPATRVVSLTPHTTEMMLSAGAGTKLVGIVNSADLTNQTKNIPKIGAYNTVSLEKILQQKPDLVLAWTHGNRHNEIKKLRQMGIPVYISNPMELKDIAKEVNDMGVLTGHTDMAKKNSQQFLNRLHNIQNTYKNKPTIRIFIQVSNDPIYTINNQTFLGKMLSICSAQNVFATAKQPAFPVSMEQVVQTNPDMIVSISHQNNLAQWKKWPITASNKNHLLFFTGKQLSRPSIGILDDLIRLCKQIDQTRT